MNSLTAGYYCTRILSRLHMQHGATKKKKKKNNNKKKKKKKKTINTRPAALERSVVKLESADEAVAWLLNWLGFMSKLKKEQYIKFYNTQ